MHQYLFCQQQWKDVFVVLYCSKILQLNYAYHPSILVYFFRHITEYWSSLSKEFNSPLPFPSHPPPFSLSLLQELQIDSQSITHNSLPCYMLYLSWVLTTNLCMMYWYEVCVCFVIYRYFMFTVKFGIFFRLLIISTSELPDISSLIHHMELIKLNIWDYWVVCA